jgi:hypothetical protein
MRLPIAVAVLGVLAFASGPGFGQARPSPSFEGVWQVTSVLNTGAGAANSIPDRQPNINIWTRRYYSRTVADGPVRAVVPAPKDPARLTDAEKLARYEHWRQFAAVSGTYDVKGNQYFQQPLVGKDVTEDILARNAGKPSPAAPTGQEIRFEGDRLVLLQTLADKTSVNRRTYVRLDKPAASGTKPHPIESVWKGTTVVVTGANQSSNSNRQPNLFIYKNGFFSRMTQEPAAAPVPPRLVLKPPADAAKLTDAEKLARYEHWAPVGAAAGRYEVKGNTVYEYPTVAKSQTAEIIARNKTGNLGTVNPNSELTFSNGNNTMVQVARTPDGKTVTTRTYTRLE